MSVRLPDVDTLKTVELADRQRDFHMEEYKQMRAEVTALLARIESLFRYSLLVAATVFSWMLINSMGAATPTIACLKLPAVIAKTGWTIGPVFVLCAGLMAGITFRRVVETGAYLGALELVLGHERLGWERFLSKQRAILTPATAALWFILLGLSVHAAQIGWAAVDAADYVCRKD